MCVCVFFTYKFDFSSFFVHLALVRWNSDIYFYFILFCSEGIYNNIQFIGNLFTHQHWKPAKKNTLERKLRNAYAFQDAIGDRLYSFVYLWPSLWNAHQSRFTNHFRLAFLIRWCFFPCFCSNLICIRQPISLSNFRCWSQSDLCVLRLIRSILSNYYVCFFDSR